MDFKKNNTDNEFEINRPHGAGRLYSFFINYKFRKSLESIPLDIKNLSILDICCGSGMSSEFYVKEGADVCGTDISVESISRAKIRAKKYGFPAKFQIANSENLPFSNNSFDVVSVHDGLHHLNNPEKAVKEMVRVAKKGVIIIEPAEAFITKISILIGISKKFEDVGNYVYRFKKYELMNWLKEEGCKRIRIKRYIMYYPHKPNWLFNIFSSFLVFHIVKILFYTINAIFGRFGNKIYAVGVK